MQKSPEQQQIEQLAQENSDLRAQLEARLQERDEQAQTIRGLKHMIAQLKKTS